MIKNYSEVLDKKYGLDGTSQRAEFEQNAYDFYSGLVLHQARKEAKITQSEKVKRAAALMEICKKQLHELDSELEKIINSLED